MSVDLMFYNVNEWENIIFFFLVVVVNLDYFLINCW